MSFPTFLNMPTFDDTIHSNTFYCMHHQSLTHTAIKHMNIISMVVLEIGSYITKQLLCA